ncbi:ATP-binding protein [Clostridium sporogenes]|uniref:ATP-binding protein n=1 Tax=Clostridium sporogenes TaxID=1509 RepID=UPI002149A3DC|nr:ATP-binding protein [Clostridium sporogenes]MCR1972661.1 ATP-binding protein [Clostridium sporogenes]
MSEVLHFKVSSGLKNIIGRELINDRYIAIFELVKNSYDAGAKNVVIKFEDIYGSNSKIIVSDDGSGMNKEDILNKWLFVAYSEKKRPSYRDNLKKRRSYAGAKGVGRFSCDRLGANATLFSKTIGDTLTNLVQINWCDFEKDEKEKFENINVAYDYIHMKELSEKGTIIEISDLREKWNRADIVQLKKSLTQLVNPDSTNNYDNFAIYLDVKEELKNDQNEKNVQYRVNGKVENYVFEVLDIKTTKINVQIDSDGKYITTTMNDRGVVLFSIKEKNIYTLKNIHCTIYNLNRAAKLNFFKIMDVEVVNYGSIFVYKNGFRVYPYGESGQDFFDIDKRKAQGYGRYLGTREIIGRMQIYGENTGLTETSSRNNGFIQSYELNELEDFFKEFVLKPLEKYVVNIIRWGEEITEDKIISNLTEFGDIDQVIKKLKPKIRKGNIVSTNYNKELMSIIESRKSKPISHDVKEIQRIAAITDNPDLFKKTEQIEKKTRELQRRVVESEENVTKANETIEATKKELDVTKNQVEILRSRANLTADEAISAMHIMKTYADAIDSNINEILEEYKDQVSTDILPILHEIRQTCSKTMNAYNLVITTKYSADTDVIQEDICEFIKRYVEQQWTEKFTVEVDSLDEVEFVTQFNPLEFSIIIDNIISNSRKANSNKINIKAIKYQEDFVDIVFSDDGKGINTDISDVARIFEPGYTRTKGSGIGLYTVKSYLEKVDGQVIVNKDYVDGFQLIVRLKLWI